MTAVSAPTLLLLTLSAINGVGPAALRKVSKIPSFWDLDLVRWSNAVPQVARAIEGQVPDLAWGEARLWADLQVAAAQKHGARILSPIDAEYPRLLAETKDDPFLLFVKGRLAAEDQQSVAIIGTREPTPHGVTIAKRITQFFVEQRWSVVSGLALGCDAVAHQAAIDLGGHTVAVLAHGLQMISPARHKELAQQILDSGGALVSEFPFGKTALGAQFVKRDRTQAGMARGVVMVQSDIKGGSLHASRAALDYRRWLAVPYPTDKDLENKEPKVQANLVIADGADAHRADLLRCPTSALRLVKVVRGREDYLRLIGEMPGERPEALSSIADSPNAVVKPRNARRATLVEPRDVAEASQGAIAEEGITWPAVTHVEPTKHVAVVEARERAPEPELATTNYYLEVSPEDLASLRTTRLPIGSPESAVDAARHRIADSDLVVMFSRLDHLQSRLDELRRAHNSKRPVDGTRALRFQFQIEDVLTQMKLATEQLVNLDHGTHRQLLRAILVTPGAATGQAELPLAVESASRLLDAPLVEVLECLVDTLPRSISVRGNKVANLESERSSGVEVHLSDLLFSFNALVRAALPQGSYRTSTTVDGQS